MQSWKRLKFFKQKMNDDVWTRQGQIEEHLLGRKIYDKAVIFPSEDNWYKALKLTPFDRVKVVILGQDPYHTKGLAHGLAFSVQAHVKTLPPSLRNIFKELQEDTGCKAPRTGDLTSWAERGVLLLNTVLTVEEGKPNSHKNIGWEKLCFEVVSALARRGGVCFVLWGTQAQEYAAACAPCPVVRSPHPSPLSRGFLGSKPFSRANEELKKLGLEPIDWTL